MSLSVPVSVFGKRPWARGALAGLLALAGLVVAVRLGGGVTQAAPGDPVVRAPAPEPPKKEEPRRDEPKKDEPGKERAAAPAPAGALPEPDELFKRMAPPGLDPEQVKRMQEQMRRSMEMMSRQMARGRQMMMMPFGAQEESRLGVQLEKPGETLVEQLDLPRGQGLVVREIETDSAAAKAGIKTHDVLLELNGKPVPDDVRELDRQLEGIKANTAVDALVLRKGKRETVKGLTLPEAAEAPLPNFNFPAAAPMLAPLPPPMMPGFAGMPGFGGNGVLTTTFRTGDRFTTRHQEGSLVITITGTVADGKVKAGEFHVQDGASTQKYDSLDKVPDQYRDKAKNLLEMSEKSARITIQP